MSAEIVHMGFVLASMAVAFSLTAFTWRMRPRVLRLRDDPPPNAHYIELDPDTAEDDDESKARKALINKQKEGEVIYHSLHFCEGRCSRRELFDTINREWNSFYEDWPEYKKYWHISEKFIRDTLDKYDYNKSGEVVRLAGDYAGAFVIVDTALNGSRGRRLIDVKDLVFTYFGKEKEKPIEAESGAAPIESGVEKEERVPVGGYSVPILAVNGATLPMAAD